MLQKRAGTLLMKLAQQEASIYSAVLEVAGLSWYFKTLCIGKYRTREREHRDGIISKGSVTNEAVTSD